MKIYFVRHGSTDSLEQKISQPDDEPLNQKGLARSQELAKRFANTQLDLIVSSPLTRSLQTAKRVSSDVLVSSLFAEVKKPTEVIGQPKDSETVKGIIKQLEEMPAINPSWHYSDEENFTDFKTRGLKALEFLKSQNKENILVVSHGNFITILVGLMLFGPSYPLDGFLRLRNFLRLSATGVSVCTFENNKWQLQSWNSPSL
jgi:broad specificity phosphatase PhoE